MVSKRSVKKSSDEISPQKMKLIEIELELSRINRERSVFVLNKAMFLYFCFLILGVISVFTGYAKIFYVLVVMGLLVLLIGSVPYVRMMFTEEKKLKELIKQLRKDF